MTVTVIADARDTSSPGLPGGGMETGTSSPPWNPAAKSSPEAADCGFDQARAEESPSSLDCTEPGNIIVDRADRVLRPAFPTCTGNSGPELLEDALRGGTAYPPFPCPFCDRAYTSWGFRRRHIKAVHTISPSLNCKWCLQVLPTHSAWRRHVISVHNLSASDAHNGLLILEEAHMVLQIARPTRLDTLVNIIKQSSQQNSTGRENSPADKD